jgi:hypothetical protein
VAGGVSDRDRGYARIVGNLDDLGKTGTIEDGGPGVYVGIRSNAGNEPDGAPIVQIGAVHEFGSADGHIPERSYLRSTVDQQRQKYADAIVRILEAATKAPDGRAALRLGLTRLGYVAAGDVQRTIVELHEPPNAPETIRKKYGQDNPLIDTGHLVQSIDSEVRGV